MGITIQPTVLLLPRVRIDGVRPFSSVLDTVPGEQEHDYDMGQGHTLLIVQQATGRQRQGRPS